MLLGRMECPKQSQIAVDVMKTTDGCRTSIKECLRLARKSHADYIGMIYLLLAQIGVETAVMEGSYLAC